MDPIATFIWISGFHLGTAVGVGGGLFWLLGYKIKKEPAMTLLIYIILFFVACGLTHLIAPPLNWGGVGGAAIALFCTWWIPRTLILARRKRKAEAKVPEVPQPKALNLPNTFFDAATGMLHVTKGTPELPEGSTIQLATPNPADAYRTPPGLQGRATTKPNPHLQRPGHGPASLPSRR